MRKSVAVITKDKFLFQKIYLILKQTRGVTTDISGADVCLWDRDSMGEPPTFSNPIILSRDGGDITIPFTEESLLSALTDRKAQPSLALGNRCAYLRGREIRLTEVEFALLSRLVCADGEFVDRSDLISSVWGDNADGGVLNVYVHYLREKLEFSGEKIIVSSRKNGYKIDKRFLCEEVEGCLE